MAGDRGPGSSGYPLPLVTNTNSKGRLGPPSFNPKEIALGRLLTPLDALRLGWSIIPCGLNKKPLVKWRKYQTELPTKEQVLEWEKLNPASWAIITGKLSNRVTLEYTKDGARTAELLGLPAPHRRSPRGGGHVDCLWPNSK